MKYFYSLLLGLLFCTLANSQVLNYVIVKGHITNTNGGAVNNWPVYVMTDSSNSSTSCNQYNTVYTNANGYYIDTLRCTGNIGAVIVSTPGCNGTTYVTHYDSVPVTKIVEDNFTICTPGATVCHAAFTATDTLGNTVLFNSSASTASTGTTIIERIWSFGDGTANTGGNIVQVTHTYAAAGTYTARLVIVTSGQCRDTVYSTVTVHAATTCSASFTYTSSGNVFSFNSSASATPAPNAIVRRKWVFDNGDTLGGNVISPTHTYTHSGYYSVCLTIYTQNGCSNTVCKQLYYADSSCAAAFSYTNSTAANTISFINTSSTGPTSPINFAAWTFGDGDSTNTTGNTVHHYSTAGTYTACLYISTASGCQSTVCHPVVIQGSTTTCHAVITTGTTAPVAGVPYYLSGSSSTTSSGNIVSYAWYFGSGGGTSSDSVLHHTFANAGTYNVYLVITSSTGCRDTAFVTLVVTAPSNTCHAVITTGNTAPVAGVPYNLSGILSTAAGGSGIVSSYSWYFADGTTSHDSAVNHTFANAGTYNVYLIITSSTGCRDTAFVTLVVTAPGTTCHARFSDSITANYGYFYSGTSSTASGDSIKERNWNFGDYNNYPNNTLGGNVVNPVHHYLYSGTFNVCLKITSVSGCKDSICKTVVVTSTCPAPIFTDSIAGSVVSFHSYGVVPPATDSITLREWQFGDGTSLNGNVANPIHTYAHAGTYQVCLVIHTSSGCVTSTCHTITITAPVTCSSFFKFNRLSQTSVQFYTVLTATPSINIIERRWTFGDGTVLGGNRIDPIKNYQFVGTYNACLRVTTSTGCVSETCMPVRIGDSSLNADTSQNIQIITLSPNPATTQFSTMIWSRHSGVAAELAILDIYGVKKWSLNQTLTNGFNTYTVPVGSLVNGPYTFRVTTIYGIKSKRFYKL